jgi:hypothetical protein
MKKKFKDTAVGKFITTNVPEALESLDGIPAVGAIKSVLKLVGVNLPKDKQDEFDALLGEYEKEMYALEVQDKDSARNREVDLAKVVGHSDYMVWFLAIAIMVAFGFIVWHLIRDSVPAENRELVTNIVGIIEGLLISIYSYYFGSSMGSRIKDMKGK